MKVYLAGPIRGKPQFNFPAFKKAAAALRADGHEVFSPAEKGEEIALLKNPSLQDNQDFRRRAFKLDTAWICENAEAIALLPGYQNSSGAVAELALARALGLLRFELDGARYV